MSDTKIFILIVMGAMVLYLLTASGHLYSPDGEIMFRTAESLLSRGAFAVPAHVIETHRLGNYVVAGTDKQYYSKFGPGQSVAAQLQLGATEGKGEHGDLGCGREAEGQSSR